MDEKLKHVSAVLNKMKKIFQCKICSEIKDENSMVFYCTCQHCYCVDCIDTEKPCIVCQAENGKKGQPTSVRITENENILGIFRSVVSYKGFSQFLDNQSKGVIDKNSLGNENSAEEEFNTSAVVNESLLDQSVASSKNGTERKKKKAVNISKRNHKGETPLHLACKKGNLELMQDLIDAGASPNEKDNAGWTPLHDSVVSGNKPVIKFLLKNGAGVNIPGHENMTALHLSVIEGHTEITRLLLKYGANRNSRNIYGDTPMDLVKKYDIKDVEDILLNTPVKLKVGTQQSFIASRSKTDIVLYHFNLNEEEISIAKKFKVRFNYRTVDKMLIHCPATHIVVPENENVQMNWDMVIGVLVGCRIVKITWMKDSLDKGIELSPNDYETTTGAYEGFAKSNANYANQSPGLFSGCHFYFGGNFELYKTKKMSFLKIELKMIVERNGGVVLTRKPDPESLALEKTIPFHAKATSSLCNTSYYIIYNKDAWDPAPKYNMSHMKTLPIEWLLASIIKFELVEPNPNNEYDWI